jgi:predicted RNase H-like HicB family nuclease
MARSVKPKNEYRVVFERDPDSGWWVATVPELAGCLTQGRTIEQARERIREAIAAVLDLRNDYAGRLVDDVRLPAKVKRTVRSAEQARKKAQRAERVASEKIREATAELGKLGMSLRDVGTVLGVSRQRAQQLTRK